MRDEGSGCHGCAEHLPAWTAGEFDPSRQRSCHGPAASIRNKRQLASSITAAISCSLSADPSADRLTILRGRRAK